MFEKDAESQCTEANIQTPVPSFLMAEDGIQLTNIMFNIVSSGVISS